MPEETASAATQLAPAHADAIEIFAEVLAQSEDEGLGDDFYSRLCEGITRCTALRRVVIFRYDSARRRILAAGSFGVDLALFAGDFFTLESAALAREALEQDRVLEIERGPRAASCPPSTSSGCTRAPSSARRCRRAGAGWARSSATAAARARR